MVADRYDEWAERYPYIFGSPDDGVEYFERTVGRQLAAVLDGGKVLDAGCGVGLSTAGLLGNGFEVVGLDLSRRSLKVAANLLKRHEGRYELVYGDALEVGVRRERFDAIVAVSSLCNHVLTESGQRRLIRGFTAALKPGGYLVIDSHDHENLAASAPGDDVLHSRIAPCPDGPAVYLERRRYREFPRSRLYDTDYYFIDSRDAVMRLSIPGRAVFLREYSRWLREFGMVEIRWLAPWETGFHKALCLARKPGDEAEDRQGPSAGTGEAPAAPDPEGDRRMVAKILPEDLPPNPFEEQPGYRRSTLYETRSGTGERVLHRRKQATLVMLSGGIDSTYGLVRLLRESDDDIVAHHIHFINVERRHAAEALACRRIVDHLKRTERDFFFTESAINRSRFRSFGMDYVAAGFEAGIVSSSFSMDRGYPIDRWTGGTCLEEELDNAGDDDVEQLQHTLNCVAAASHPAPPPRFFQLPIIAKRRQMEYMGPELVALCWTCRTPVWAQAGHPVECGRCKTCLLMREIRNGRPTVATGAKPPG